MNTSDNVDADRNRRWQTLLLGGASGTGKTAVSYRIARHFDVGITEVDDLYIVLERMTTPEQQPLLHYWNTHPEAMNWSAERILEHHLAVAQVMTPALEAVIVNHLETLVPIVLEGDYLLPSLAAQTQLIDAAASGQIVAVFLYEPDEEQLALNFRQREPAAGEQKKRARVSWLYGQWLKAEAAKYHLPALQARPWDTLFERILAAIGSSRAMPAPTPQKEVF